MKRRETFPQSFGRAAEAHWPRGSARGQSLSASAGAARDPCCLSRPESRATVVVPRRLHRGASLSKPPQLVCRGLPWEGLVCMAWTMQTPAHPNRPKSEPFFPEAFEPKCLPSKPFLPNGIPACPSRICLPESPQPLPSRWRHPSQGPGSTIRARISRLPTPESGLWPLTACLQRREGRRAAQQSAQPIVCAPGPSGSMPAALRGLPAALFAVPVHRRGGPIRG